jgi:hypothetical protein
MLQTNDNFSIILADTGAADAALTTPATYLDFDWSDARMNFSKDFYTSTNKIMFTIGTAMTALAFNSGYSLIDINETSRDIVIKAGVDINHNIITGSGAGGSYISLSETGAGIMLSLSSKTEAAAFTDDFYISLTQSACTISGVNLYLAGLSLYFGAASNDYLIYNDTTKVFQFYADNSSTASIIKAGSFDTQSSFELKHNIIKFNESAIDLINSIDIVSYNYKDDSNQRPKVGFIAEQTNSYFSTPSQDSFDLTNSIAILIKAVQELDYKIKHQNMRYI